MKRAPIPDDDEQRLEVLRSFDILDTEPETTYDDLVRLASFIAGTPIALVSLVDEDRQWFKARVGLGATQTPRDVSFCGHAVASGETLVVPDAHDDPRFADNPLVTGAPHVRFYAGSPIVSTEGANLGTLCVIDHKPRVLDDEKQGLLEALSRQVGRMMELRRSERRKQDALDALAIQQEFWELSLEMLCILDASGQFLQANPSFAERLGRPEGALVGTRLSEVVHAEDHERMWSFLEEVSTGDAAASLVCRVMASETEARVFQWSARPTSDGALILAAARDVTSEREAAEALRAARDKAEHASQLKSAFLANMSHELRTPLNSVIGFARLLGRKSVHLEAKEQVYVERIHANGKHLLSLINDVLDLSRIEAGRMRVSPERVDVAALVQEVAAALEGRRSETELFLRVRGCDSPALAFADPLRLRQVLTNLMGNALKFTEQGGMEVRLQQQDGWATSIEVSDSGIGIAAEHLQQLFQPFYQVEHGFERRFEGTGLGLAISRRLCTMMGFDLHVATVAEEGSTFQLRLDPDVAPRCGHRPPSSEGVGIDAPVVPEPAVLQKQHTVLVIDDEPDARLVIEQQLQDLGYRVATADSGARGLQLARTLLPSLITLDLHMPETSGWDVLRILRESDELRDIPVVVCSVVAGRVVGHPCGSVAVLNKPLDTNALESVLHDALDKDRPHVLVVDDDLDVLDAATDQLRAAGLRISTATGGEDALAQLAQDPMPDLVLLDLQMPGLDGAGTLAAIRSSPRTAQLPVIVWTARDADDVSPGVAEGALRVLRKHGLDLSEVERAVHLSLGVHSRPHEPQSPG